MSAKFPTLDNIKQTHKTILFDKFSHAKDEDIPDLFSIIQAAKSSGTFNKEEFFIKIEEELTVRSFQEFIERFAPKVYEYAQSMGDKKEILYTMDKDDVKNIEYNEISIAEHPFFEMLLSMYTQKADSDKSNLEFQEDKVKKLLTPEKQMEKVYNMRKKVRSLAIDRFKAEQAHRSTAPYDQALYDCRVEITKTFDESPLMHLALGITQAEQQIKKLEQDIKQLDALPDGESPQLIKGKFRLNENGEPEIVAVSKDSNTVELGSANALALEEGAVREVLCQITTDVRDNGPDSEFVQGLLIQLYAPQEVTSTEQAMDLPALNNMVANYAAHRERLMAVYRQAQEAFINALVEMTQKLLGVMAFFDHATTGGIKAELPAGLIVTNCKIEQFLENDEAKKDLQAFLSHLGTETNGKKIWLGILPDVLMSDSGKGGGGKSPAWNAPIPGRKNRQTSENEAKQETAGFGVNLESAKTLLKMVDEAGILTVFSFQPDKATSFADFSLKTLENMQAALESVDYPHAVCAYPNFTVMREGTLDLGSGEIVPIPAVYISASFVAAGLIAASQQEKVLRSKNLGDRLVSGEVNTRIDLEDKAVNRALKTRFNRELAYSWDSGIIPEIVRKRFGFVFCSDFKTDPVDGKPYKNSYVLQASTMEKDETSYQPVYVTLTRDFVENYQQHRYGQGMGEDDAREFMKIAGDWQNDALRSDADKKLNLVLRKDETIEREEGPDISFTINLAGGKVRVKPKIKTKTRS